jgi:hypothetical protein
MIKACQYNKKRNKQVFFPFKKPEKCKENVDEKK